MLELAQWTNISFCLLCTVYERTDCVCVAAYSSFCCHCCCCCYCCFNFECAPLFFRSRSSFCVCVFFLFAAVPGSHQVINMFEKLLFAGEYARCTMCCACKDVFEHENILYEYLCISIEIWNSKVEGSKIFAVLWVARGYVLAMPSHFARLMKTLMCSTN